MRVCVKCAGDTLLGVSWCSVVWFDGCFFERTTAWLWDYLFALNIFRVDLREGEIFGDKDLCWKVNWSRVDERVPIYW